MKRSHGRRLVPGLQVLATLATVGALVHCSGGERPPPASDDFDAGGTIPVIEAGAGAVSILDVDLEQGIKFGENGFTNCGTTASAKTITLKNTINDVVNYEAEVIVGKDRFDVTPAAGAIPVRGESAIQIVPKPVPGTADVGNDLYGGVLEIRLPRRSTPTQIPLHQTARGAIVSLGATSYTLGAVQAGSRKTIPINIQNTGNLEVTATLAVTTPPYTINGAQTAPVTLGPSTTESRSLEFAPSARGTFPDTLGISYNASAVFCKPQPLSATITGDGTTGVTVSPGTLDFGNVNCGTTAEPQDINITSTIAMTFTPTLDDGALSAFTLRNATTGATIATGTPIDVPAASTFRLRVVPKPVPPVSSTVAGFFDDNLAIATSLDATVINVPLKETAQGAVLSFTPTTISTSARVATVSTTNFTLQNSGNQQVPYQITTTPSATFDSTLKSGNALPGATSGILRSTSPSASGTTITGSMSVQLGPGGGVLCADLPPPVPLSATGTGAAVTANPTNLTFGLVECGKVAAAQTITIESVTATKIRVNLAKGVGSPFTLQTSAGAPLPLNSEVNVAVGTPVLLRVVPATIPIPGSTATNFYGDSLTLTSDIPAEPVITVPLTQTGQGAIFNYPGSIGAKAPFTITNTGNGTGRVTIAGADAGNGTFVLLPSASVGGVALDAAGSITITAGSDFATCAAGTGTIAVIK